MPARAAITSGVRRCQVYGITTLGHDEVFSCRGRYVEVRGALKVHHLIRAHQTQTWYSCELSRVESHAASEPRHRSGAVSWSNSLFN
jgi:hypothetical protein